MAIDLYRKGRITKKGIRKSSSNNLYLGLLIKLYKFLSRKTDSKFNKTILRRLSQSRVNRCPVSLSKIIKHLGEKTDRIVVVPATITNDVRIGQIPKLTVCALKVTETARKRILAAGGKIMTFDQLATKAPKGSNCLLLRGGRFREAKRHFGLKPGQKGSHSAPYVRSEGRKFERAAGRR